MIDAYTDYPICSYGDSIITLPIPTRKVKILTYDRNKYCDVLVYEVDDDGDLRGHITSIKSGYLYKLYGSENKVLIPEDVLKTLPWRKV